MDNKFYFHWNMTKEDWRDINNYEAQLETGMDSVGQCRIGDLCFDFTLRDYEDQINLDYDLYVGGVDTGYGYGEDNYPYDYGDGSGWNIKDILVFSFDEFRSFAEKEMAKYINSCGCADKAKQPLHIW